MIPSGIYLLETVWTVSHEIEKNKIGYPHRRDLDARLQVYGCMIRVITPNSIQWIQMYTFLVPGNLRAPK